jgi:hypothetical protein
VAARVGRARPQDGGVVIQDHAQQVRAVFRAAELRQVEDPQEAEQVRVEVADRPEVGTGEGELDERLLDQVVRPHGVVGAQVQGPPAQPLIAGHENLFMARGGRR